jgi:thiamine-monophosphate kinase
MKARRPGEREMIAGIRRAAQRGVKTAGVRLGIGDDCAILAPPRGHELLVTTDLSLEGRHFRREWHPARAIGHRVLARGLSDLAAMGAKPLAAFLSLGLPGELAGSAWLREFIGGLLGLARAAGVTLAGGDTAEFANGVVADIVLTGSAPLGSSLRRSGARAGDGLYVTGVLGGATAELLMLVDAAQGRSNTVAVESASHPHLKGEIWGTRIGGEHPHLYPQPRLAVGAALRRRGLATACIDVSDGLSTDLAHICAESGCGAVVREAAIPVHPLAAAREDAMQMALHGGEDYELLFTATGPVPRRIAGVRITRIGEMTAGRGVKMIGMDGKSRSLKAAGWEHFSAARTAGRSLTLAEAKQDGGNNG